MSARKIIQYPAFILESVAKPVEKITDEIKALAADMFFLMRERGGYGLAAPQVGESVRMFVTEAIHGTKEPARVHINPILKFGGGNLVYQTDESCLSMPGIVGRISRRQKVSIHSTDLDGNIFTADSRYQRQAIVWQHETDHLDGILILNRMRFFDLARNMKALEKLRMEKTQ